MKYISFDLDLEIECISERMTKWMNKFILFFIYLLIIIIIIIYYLFFNLFHIICIWFTRIFLILVLLNWVAIFISKIFNYRKMKCEKLFELICTTSVKFNLINIFKKYIQNLFLAGAPSRARFHLKYFWLSNILASISNGCNVLYEDI